MNKKLKILIGSSAVVITIALTFISKKSAKRNGCASCNSSSCGSCSKLNISNTKNQTYYISKEKKLMEELKNWEKYYKVQLSKKYDDKKIGLVFQETEKEFKELLPQIPYIGGDDNDLTANLEESAMHLALYKVVKKDGITAEQVGDIAYNSTKDKMADVNIIKASALKVIGQLGFTELNYKKTRKEAAESKKKKYDGDWVFDFVEGDKNNFEYGVDYTECGIVKFYHTQGAEELAPYLCKIDFAVDDLLGQGLFRTETIAGGCKKCDFRYKK